MVNKSELKNFKYTQDVLPEVEGKRVLAKAWTVLSLKSIANKTGSYGVLTDEEVTHILSGDDLIPVSPKKEETPKKKEGSEKNDK